MERGEWLARYAEALGIEPPDDAVVDTLLRLAGVAAHASERTAAPVACWMAATAGRDAAEALRVAEQMNAE